MEDEEGRSWQALVPDARRVLENALGTLVGGTLLALGAQLIGAINLSAGQVLALVGGLAAVAFALLVTIRLLALQTARFEREAARFEREAARFERKAEELLAQLSEAERAAVRQSVGLTRQLVEEEQQRRRDMSALIAAMKRLRWDRDDRDPDGPGH